MQYCNELTIGDTGEPSAALICVYMLHGVTFTPYKFFKSRNLLVNKNIFLKLANGNFNVALHLFLFCVHGQHWYFQYIGIILI